MNVMSIIQTGIKQAGSFAVKESPSLLTGFTVAGIATSIFMAARGGIKADKLIRDETEFRLRNWVEKTGEDESSYPEDEILTLQDKVELTWRCYGPAVIMGIASGLCAIGANSIHLRRNAALASLYALTDTALREYQEAVVERLGPKADEKVRDGIVERQLREHPMNNCEVIITGRGDTLMFETLSGRYFKSDYQTLLQKQNEFNKSLIVENSKSLNQWYDALNLDHLKIGEHMGWTSDNLLEINPRPKLIEDDPNKTPVIAIHYMTNPIMV